MIGEFAIGMAKPGILLNIYIVLGRLTGVKILSNHYVSSNCIILKLTAIKMSRNNKAYNLHFIILSYFSHIYYVIELWKYLMRSQQSGYKILTSSYY